MSRRCHHGSPRHVPLGRIPRRPEIGDPQRRVGTGDLEGSRALTGVASEEGPDFFEPADLVDLHEPMPLIEERARAAVATAEPLAAVPATEPPPAPRLAVEAPRLAAYVARPAPRPFQPSPNPTPQHVEGEDAAIERTATAPQLRRFIKSRAYVPMHELRRRFGISGGDDEVTPVDLERTRVFVGLPEREGRLLGELLHGGDIGYELSLDPITPIVVGVYPMRPVTRG